MMIQWTQLNQNLLSREKKKQINPYLKLEDRKKYQLMTIQSRYIKVIILNKTIFLKTLGYEKVTNLIQ